MLTQEELKSFALEAVAEMLAEFADTFSAPLHCDLFDDQTGASPGRVASFELDGNGKLLWWTWKSDDACARSSWPIKARLEFDDDRCVIWLRGKSWDIEDHPLVRRNRPAHV